MMTFTTGVQLASATDENVSIIEMKRTSDELWSTDVIVNGEGPYRMIVDTAAAISALRRHVPLTQGRELPQNRVVVHGLLDTDDAPFIQSDFKLGVLKHSGPTVLVTDPDAIADSGVSGLVGLDILRSARETHRYLVLDLQNGRLELADRLAEIGFSNKPVWIRQSHIGRELGFIAFPIRIDRVRATAVLDTGLRFAVANEALAAKLKKRGASLLEEKLIDATGEERTLKAAHLKNIQAGNIKWSASTVLIHDSPALNRLATKSEPVLLLGLQHFQDQIILIDLKHRRVAVTQTRDFGGPRLCTGSQVFCPSDTKSFGTR